MKTTNVILIVMAVLLLASCTGTAVLLFGQDTPVVSANIADVQDKNTITVSATGEVSVIPDVGYITMGVEVRNEDAKAAEQENASIMEAVMEALAVFGLDENDVQTTNYSIYPIYDDYSDEKPMRYEINNTVRIRVRDLEIIGDVIDAATDAGANRSSSISFDYEDREQAYNEALANAVENAKTRAQTIAEASGCSVTGIISITESNSYSSYYTSNSMLYGMGEDSSGTSISSGDMDITASVSVVFETEPLE